jgi:hypothetical protein
MVGYTGHPKLLPTLNPESFPTFSDRQCRTLKSGLQVPTNRGNHPGHGEMGQCNDSG